MNFIILILKLSVVWIALNIAIGIANIFMKVIIGLFVYMWSLINYKKEK